MFPNELLSRLLRALGDPARKSVTIIDQLERFTHDGNAFYTEVLVTIASGATTNLVSTIGANSVCMRNRFAQTVSSAGVDSIIELYEGVTTTGVPTAIPVFNLNRNSLTLPTFSHATGLSFADGTKLPSTLRLVSENKSSSSVSENTEYIMKKNTKYGLKITNNGAQSATILFRWYFYECSEV